MTDVEPDETEPTDEDLDAIEAEEGSDDDDAYTPPSRSEFSKLQRDLKRANAQAKKLKDAAKAAPTDDDKADLKIEGYTEAEGKYKPLLVKHAAKAQLTTMGFKADPDRYLKLLDLDEIDVDDDGDLDGLEDQLDNFRDQFPELFDARKIKGDKRTRADASDRSPGGTSGKSNAQILAERALSGSS